MSIRVRVYRLELVHEGNHETKEAADAWITQDGLFDVPQPTGLEVFTGGEDYKLYTYHDTDRPPSKNRFGYRWFWRRPGRR